MKKHIGSSFESFLEEKGIKDEVELRAQKEILAEPAAPPPPGDTRWERAAPSCIACSIRTTPV